MSDFPTYGDVLNRPADDPDRDQIKATPDWTPIRIPGGGWRHWIDGQQIDTPTEEPPQ